MTASLLRTASPQPLRLHPIPGAPVCAELPGLETWSRDALMSSFKEASDAYRAKSYYRPDVTHAARARVRIIRDEWMRRVAYHRDEELRRDVAAHNDDVACRVEVMLALVAEGKSLIVSAALTDTTAKMLCEGKRLGVF